MASRKAKPPSPQLGLGLSLPSSDETTETPPPKVEDGGRLSPSPSPASVHQWTTPDSAASVPPVADSLDLDSFDDYDDSAIINETPRLRLVDPPAPIPSIIVEVVGDRYEVSRLRDNGTTVACVMYTRAELEELARRIQAALEMG